jgi:hypothetical protein
MTNGGTVEAPFLLRDLAAAIPSFTVTALNLTLNLAETVILSSLEVYRV